MSDSSKLEQHYFGYSNTTGYYLTPQVAQNLHYSQEWIHNVDIGMDRFYETHVALLVFLHPVLNQITQTKSDYSE